MSIKYDKIIKKTKLIFFRIGQLNESLAKNSFSNLAFGHFSLAVPELCQQFQ